MTFVHKWLGIPDEQIKEAVNQQLQPLWPSVGMSFFGGPEAVARRQKRLDEIRAWVAQTADRQVRAAQEDWCGVAQYTIDSDREEHEKKAAGRKLVPHLPPLPAGLR